MEFLWLYDIFTSLSAFSTDDFINFALASAATKMHTSVRARTEGGTGF